MKIHFLAFFLFSFLCVAQAPQGVSYQAVAFNAAGAPINNSTVGVKISILQGSVTGSEVYAETHAPQTNNQGLFNLNIGQGTPQGASFETIDWGSGSKFIKVEVDPNGGNNYTTVGTNQLMSVPYALYAENVNTSNGNLLNQINDGKTANFAMHDYINGQVLVFNSAFNLWSSVAAGDLSGGFTASDKNFAFYDYINNVVQAYSSISNTWISQSLGDISNDGIVASQGNFAFYDYINNLVYAFNSSNEAWSSQVAGDLDNQGIVTSNGSFAYHDYINNMVYAYNSNNGTWVGQSIGDLSNEGIITLNGNFVLYDYINNLAFGFSKNFGTWQQQSIGDLSSDGLVPSGF